MRMGGDGTGRTVDWRWRSSRSGYLPETSRLEPAHQDTRSCIRDYTDGYRE